MEYKSPGCVIFDIDGTLANINHRRHLVRTKPKNWSAFIKGMSNDLVNEDIVWILKTFHMAGVTILIASGRSESERKITVDWLDNVAGISGLYSRLYMRKLKDNRSDYIVKGELLDQMLLDGYNPTIAIDDRNSVVKMWRSRGLRCLQVDEGDF